MTNLTDLIARVEAANADEQAELLGDAWNALAQADRDFRRFACAIVDDRGTTNAGVFANMVAVGAYESAALMLVPDGLWLRITVDPNGRANVRLGDMAAVTAATPALALCAAALKAWEKKL